MPDARFDLGPLASLTTPLPMPDLMTWDDWVVDYAIDDEPDIEAVDSSAPTLDLTRFTWQPRA